MLKSTYLIIYKNLLNIIKASYFQFIWITLLISFLLFLLNLFLWVSYNISNFSWDLRHKLWIYFYIKEDVNQKDKIYSKAINLKSDLEEQWLKVEFYSKEDAFKLLEKRMPEIIKNFEKYGIENPLPPTIYVIFDNKEKYDKLVSTIDNYKDIIINTDDVSLWKTFTQQEDRIVNVINFTNFMVIFTYFLIAILVVIIMSFLLFVIKNNFYVFYKQIEVEKLLWAFYWQIKSPFIINILLILGGWFLLMIIYFSSFINMLSDYFQKVFSLNLLEHLSTKSDMLFQLFVVELIVIILLSFLISNFFLNRLIRKV